MRILHVLNHTRSLNGHVHAAVDLACAQARLGHRVAVASAGGDFDSLLAANGVETMTLDHERRPATLAKSLAQLWRLTGEWRADVVHAHMMTSAVLGWPVCTLRRIPLVTTVHNAFEKSAILMGLGTRVIAVSAAVSQSMARRGVPKSRLHVVLNGTIGSARFEGRDRTPRRLDSPSVLFLGGLHPRKGLPDLFEAFDIVHASFPAARLYVAGDGPHLETYEAQVAALACADAVTFLGVQENPFPTLAGADIFVLPSHADPAPLVLSEAREAGCAIIASNVDGIPQLLEYGKAGLLTPPRDPKQLAAAMGALLGDPALLRSWREKSQENIGYLRIDRVARDTLAIYDAAWRQLHPRRLPADGESVGEIA
jgi:glycosyltransferase involved in cell wall biosynthesis